MVMFVVLRDDATRDDELAGEIKWGIRVDCSRATCPTRSTI